MRRREATGQTIVELRRQINHRDYMNYLAQRDGGHYTVRKKRRCFLWDQMYFQMDIYLKPSTPRCDGLVILECFTTCSSEELKHHMPPFLNVIKNVTNDPEYSMFNLSLKSDSSRNDPISLQKKMITARINGTTNAVVDGRVN
jgi:hypothetical protein